MNTRRLFLMIFLLVFSFFEMPLSYSTAYAYDMIQVTGTDIKVRSDHPRLLITPEMIPTLRERVAPGAIFETEYNQLKSQVDSWLNLPVDDFIIHNEGQRRTQTLYPAFLYLIEGDEKYAELTKRMLDWFLSNGDYLEYRGYGALSIALDWIYPTLTSQDKNKYFKPLRAYDVSLEQTSANDAGHYPKYYPTNLNSVHSAKYIATGLLLVGDSQYGAVGENIVRIHGQFFRNFSVSSYNIASGTTGGWHEDINHTTMATTIVYLMEFWRTATGEDLFQNSSYAGNLAKYALYSAAPYWGCSRIFSIEGNIPQFLILANRYQDPFAQWIIKNVTLYPVGNIANPTMWHILWYNENLEPVNLDSIQKARLFDGAGYLAVCNDFSNIQNNDPTPTEFAEFIAGDWFRSHQSTEQGNFTIYKNGWLVYRYEKSTFESRDSKEFSVMIIDGEDQLNSSQLRYMSELEIAPDLGGYDRPAGYNTVDVVHYDNDTDYTYIMADLTRAYNPEKVSYLSREFVSLGSGYYVVFDRVQTKSAQSTKQFYLQLVGQPIISGNMITMDNNSGGRLYVKCLLPNNPKISSEEWKNRWRLKV